MISGAGEAPRGQPDLQGIAGDFRAPRSIRRTVAATTQLVAGVFLVVSAVQEADRLLVVVAVLTAVSGALNLLPAPRWDRTVISDEGVRLARWWGPPLLLRWSQVRRVQPAWYPNGKSTVVSTDGRKRALHFVPREVAAQLAARLQTSSPSATRT